MTYYDTKTCVPNYGRTKLNIAMGDMKFFWHYGGLTIGGSEIENFKI